MRRVVVLPHPEGPRRAKNDPAGIVRFSSSIAVKPGNRLLTPSSWRSAPDDAGEAGVVGWASVSGSHEDVLERRPEGLLLGAGERPERLHLGQRLLVGEDELVLGGLGVDRDRGLLRTPVTDERMPRPCRSREAARVLARLAPRRPILAMPSV